MTCRLYSALSQRRRKCHRHHETNIRQQPRISSATSQPTLTAMCVTSCPSAVRSRARWPSTSTSSNHPASADLSGRSLHPSGSRRSTSANRPAIHPDHHFKNINQKHTTQLHREASTESLLYTTVRTCLKSMCISKARYASPHSVGAVVSHNRADTG